MWFDNSLTIFSNPDKQFISLFHALSAYIKSSQTASAWDDIMDARQCLGGYGYSYYSKIGELINALDVN